LAGVVENMMDAVVIADSSADSRVKAHLEEAKEFVWVPILFQSEVLGAISADRKKSLNPIETEDQWNLY